MNSLVFTSSISMLIEVVGERESEGEPEVMGTRSDTDSCVGAYTPSSSATNWDIAGGSLSDSITFESFFTSINDPDQLTPDFTPKSPLILRTFSPDSDPCEITVCFAQKHEIRQVYVRSTARVYEIYYATNFQSDNEYLCTVRCGVASRGEGVLRTNDVVFSAHSKGLDEGPGENLNGRNLSTNEDGWVEVKVSENHVFDDKNILASISGSDSARIMQDYYEATAEITDANPCSSITLRLLSLQNKCCAHVDEVYVFADPVDSAEKETGLVENSNGSSLLTMLGPSILRLSKFNGINKADDGHISNREERCKFPDVESKVNDSTNMSTKLALEGKFHMVNQGEVKVEEVNSANVDQPPAQVPLEVHDKHGSPAFTCMENTLDQLVSRIDRMENFFSRFEENILKPINSIEARLQMVEQHLEVLAKKSQSSTLPYCSRIVEPGFSCIGSNSNSFCVDGNDHPSNGSFEEEKMELNVDVPFVAQDNMPNSANSTPMLPTLVITAPEFSAGDDEEENDALKIEGDSLKYDEKPVMSIDDALASALAGFIVSTSIQTSKDPQAPSTAATEFSNDNNNRTASSRDQSETAKDDLNNAEETHGTECRQDSALSYLSPNIEGDAFQSPSHNHSAKNSDDLDHDCRVAGSDRALFLAEQKGAEASKKTEIETSCDLDRDEVNMRLPNVIDDDSDINQAESTGSMREGSDIDIVHNVLGFTRCSSVVDFEYPLLDVKFVALGNSCSKLSLEGLLVDMAKSHGVNEESEDDSPPIKQYNSILAREQFSMGSVTNNHFSVDLNYCNIMDGHPEPDGELGVCSTGSDGTPVSLI